MVDSRDLDTGGVVLFPSETSLKHIFLMSLLRTGILPCRSVFDYDSSYSSTCCVLH